MSRALNLAMRSTDAEGWVRGRFAMTPEKQAEFSELRATVGELTLAFESALSASKSMPDDLASGEDAYLLETVVSYQSASGLYAEQNLYEPAEILYETLKLPVTWNRVMSALAPRLVDEASEQEIEAALNDFAKQLLLDEHNSLLPASLGYLNDVLVSRRSLDDVLMQLFALNITSHGEKTRGVSDRNKYWRLTDMGKDLLLKLRAIKKPQAVPQDGET